MAHYYHHVDVLPNGDLNGLYRTQKPALKNGLDRIRRDCPDREWCITYFNAQIGGKWVKQYFIAEITG
jgi:hypothetical protein